MSPLHIRPEPPLYVNQRGWRGAEAVFALALAAAVGHLTGSGPAFAIGLGAYGLAALALRYLIERSRKPLAVAIEDGHVQLTQYRWCSLQPHAQSWPVSDFRAVLSHLNPGPSTHTVLLHQTRHRPPVLLDIHPPGNSGLGWRKKAIEADLPASARLRADLAQASGLPDLGFIGACYTEQLTSHHFLTSLPALRQAPPPPATPP